MPGWNQPQWNNPTQGDIDTTNQLLWQRGGQPNSGGPTAPPPSPASTQQFGTTPQGMYGNYLTPTSASSTGAALNKMMGRQAPTIAGADFSGMGQTQASQLGLLQQMQNYAQGLGPSAAQVGNTMAMGQAAGAGRAGLAGGNALAARAGLGAQVGGLNSAAMQGGQARSAETGQMMGALGKQGLGLSNNALGASSLADLQIQQQQALGLGQAQRNYQLGQGTIGTASQEQMDFNKFQNQLNAIKQQRENDTVNNWIKMGGTAATTLGTMA